MEEVDYDDWLIEKSEISGFDELDEYLKKAIYETELGFTDEEELKLYEINHSTNTIIFDWTGYKNESERLNQAMEETGCVQGGGLIYHDYILKEELMDWAQEFYTDWKFEMIISYDD